MADTVQRADLAVSTPLAAFVEKEALPGVALAASDFWSGLSRLVRELGPKNRALLDKRGSLQRAIDDWHRARAGKPHDASEYRSFLEEIGYLVPDPDDVTVDTSDVDAEIALIAGPQLVCPVANRRFALNAANARWGSLYDALYGTDALGSTPPAGPFDADRAAQVRAWVRALLDDVTPLSVGSHADAAAYAVRDGVLTVKTAGGEIGLADPSQLAGWRGAPEAPEAVLLQRHGLHVELRIDRGHPVGAADPAGLADVLIEAALTAIMDFEDSIAAVDGEDKTEAYRVWLELAEGRLTHAVEKGGRLVERRLAEDRVYSAQQGKITLPGRALMLVRNVGHLMTTPAVLDG